MVDAGAKGLASCHQQLATHISMYGRCKGRAIGQLPSAAENFEQHTWSMAGNCSILCTCICHQRLEIQSSANGQLVGWLVDGVHMHSSLDDDIKAAV